MKKILLSLIAISLLAIQSTFAVTQVFTVPAGAVPQTNFFTLSATINSVSIFTGSSGGATNLTYALVDQPTNNGSLGWGPLKQTNAAFIQVSQYTTNITRITTNFSGALYTNTISNAVFSYTNTVPAMSNDWRRIAIGNVGSNSTITITGPFPVVYGLGITNQNIGKDIVVTVNYDPAL